MKVKENVERNKIVLPDMIHDIEEYNKKVKRFFMWYRRNVRYCKNNEWYLNLFELKEFINRFVYWYEARYPVNKVDEALCNDSVDLENIMNNYLNGTNVEEVNYRDLNDIKMVDYLYSTFKNNEKCLMKKSTYPREMDFYYKGYYYTIKVDNNGIIENIECNYNRGKFNDKGIDKDLDNVIGGSVVALAGDLYNSDYRDKNRDIVMLVDNYRKKKFIREMIFNSVMYKLIYRGSFYLGPKRGLMFAREFNLDKNIPMEFILKFKKYFDSQLVDKYAELSDDKVNSKVKRKYIFNK